MSDFQPGPLSMALADKFLAELTKTDPSLLSREIVLKRTRLVQLLAHYGHLRDEGKWAWTAIPGALAHIVNADGQPAIAQNRDTPKPAPELFYIQNRGYCGNCLSWWRDGGHGYTTNLDEAWKVPQEQAERICASRPHEDTAWPVSQIDAITCRHVNVEHLRLCGPLAEEKLRYTGV